jgi:tetratricopeptide (TPR) repeat protein
MKFYAEAEKLRSEGKFLESLRILLEGLSTEPQNSQARLLLSRVFYEQGFIPFAIRELEELLKTFPENGSIIKLHEKLAIQRHSDADGSHSTIAEGEFEVEDL